LTKVTTALTTNTMMPVMMTGKMYLALPSIAVPELRPGVNDPKRSGGSRRNETIPYP
jgi:hypothetical protein